MFITEDFVMLNLPKTGSSFARAVLKELYDREHKRTSLINKFLIKLKIISPLYKELVLPNIKIQGVKQEYEEHGTYIQIPKNNINRKIFSIVRNPYDRFLSSYEFRAWERKRQISDELINEHFPTFPNLTIDDYLRLQKLTMKYGRLGGRELNCKIGTQSVQFIQMFFKNPKKVLENITDEYIDSDKVFDDIADISFIKQENLRTNLINFLLQNGFNEKDVNFINDFKRVNTTKKIFKDRTKLWTQNSVDYIKKEERLIFKILKKYGIEYSFDFELGDKI